MMNHTTLFEQHRGHLFAIAYRMLGQAMDAEDILQDGFLRWQQIDLASVETPKAFLTTMITRLCLDFLRSARVQRERYIGPWLPEPVLTSHLPAVAETVALRESVSIAFLFLLETLSPVERAGFLLREVFDYDYSEIADIIDKSPANSRKIVSRARQRLTAIQPNWTLQPTTTDETHIALIEQFVGACLHNDVSALKGILHQDAILWSDGGGKVVAARKPVMGAEKIALFMINLRKLAPDHFSMRVASTNGLPSLILYSGADVLSLITFAVRAGRIIQFQNILNPDKLERIPRAS